MTELTPTQTRKQKIAAIGDQADALVKEIEAHRDAVMDLCDAYERNLYSGASLRADSVRWAFSNVLAQLKTVKAIALVQVASTPA